MKDFFCAAFPWVVMGLLLAVYFARMSHKTKNQDTREDYGLLGMLLGLTIGMATGKFLLGSGSMGMSIGMLAGLILGSFIHKEKQEEEK